MIFFYLAIFLVTKHLAINLIHYDLLLLKISVQNSTPLYDVSFVLGMSILLYTLFFFFLLYTLKGNLLVHCFVQCLLQIRLPFSSFSKTLRVRPNEVAFLVKASMATPTHKGRFCPWLFLFLYLSSL